MQNWRGATIIVPADPSSAAFLVAAAAIMPGSDVLVTIEGILTNPTRTGLLYDAGVKWEATSSFENERLEAGEPVADIRCAVIAAIRTTAFEVPAERAPSMIDEYPILAVVAAFAIRRRR